MKLLISSFILLIFISTSAHGGSGLRYPFSDLLEPIEPIIILIVGLAYFAVIFVFIAIFAVFKFSAMLLTLVCIGLIGVILIFFLEEKILSIEKFLSRIIGMPPIVLPTKKFLFAGVNDKEFIKYCAVLLPLLIMSLIGIYGLDLWINLFNYKSSFFANTLFPLCT